MFDPILSNGIDVVAITELPGRDLFQVDGGLVHQTESTWMVTKTTTATLDEVCDIFEQLAYEYHDAQSAKRYVCINGKHKRCVRTLDVIK